MRFTQREIKQALLACGMMLMLGWFTLSTSYIEQADTVGQANLSKALEVPVLMYHHLVPEQEAYGVFAENNIVVTVEKFKTQMETLKQEGYQTISLAQLRNFVEGKGDLPSNSILLTFDDGYLSNYEYAYPILKELGYQGVIFLLTSAIEEKAQVYQPRAVQYLSWQEIAQMRDVFEFGCHTDNLHRLTSRGKGCLTEATAEEIVMDLTTAERKMGKVLYYCYPYGHYTHEVIEVLQQEGIRLAFTIGADNVQVGDEQLRLPRWDMAQYELTEVLQTVP